MILFMYYKYYYFLVYILSKLNIFDFSGSENDSYLETEGVRKIVEDEKR
jgi:hypothetical protein